MRSCRVANACARPLKRDVRPLETDVTSSTNTSRPLAFVAIAALAASALVGSTAFAGDFSAQDISLLADAAARTHLAEASCKIFLGEITSKYDNTADYRHFEARAYGCRTADASVSTLLGHFAVNIHTGEVWETDTEALVTDGSLIELQVRLRAAEGVDEVAVKRHRNDLLQKP